MATPEASSTHPPAGSPSRAEHPLAQAADVSRAARIIASATLSITLLSGVLMHFIDEKTHPNIGDGLWWAIQTVTTVGYGDLVPESTSGRLVAGLVMVVGIGFLTVITAAITSAFIESARRRLPAPRPTGSPPSSIRSRRVWTRSKRGSRPSVGTNAVSGNDLRSDYRAPQEAEEALEHTIADVERRILQPATMEPPPETVAMPTFHQYAAQWWRT